MIFLQKRSVTSMENQEQGRIKSSVAKESKNGGRVSLRSEFFHVARNKLSPRHLTQTSRIGHHRILSLSYTISLGFFYGSGYRSLRPVVLFPQHGRATQ